MTAEQRTGMFTAYVKTLLLDKETADSILKTLEAAYMEGYGDGVHKAKRVIAELRSDLHGMVNND